MHILGNINRLDREAWLLILESGLFAVATALSNTFVNVYLWKIKNDLVIISWFNFTHYLTSAVTFVIAGWMAKRVDRVVAIRLGVALLAAFYLTVLLIGTKSIHYVILLGVLLGLGGGFFWLAYNVLYFEITARENRDIYNGVNGLFGSVAGISAPLISGLIITRVDNFTGYSIIFGISLAIFLAAVVVSFMFKSRSAHGSYRLFPVISMTKRRKNHWYWVCLAMMAHGLREGVFVFLIGLLVYVITRDELTLGAFFTASSLVSLISFYIVGRFMKPGLRNLFIFIGTLMMGLVILPFIFYVNYWTMFILGVGAALFYPLYMAPLTSTVFDFIGENEKTVQMRVEYVVVRELALNLGRLAGILIFIWWISYSSDVMHIRWFVLGVGFTQMLAWWAIKQVPILNPEPAS
ncbi:MFS transporter [Paenactinomyces guangxiensis]|uniref:MFS transporter n=1 Tax=Paenactinomyces guangxiensis TaxID=1490290 RepID=A0A7W1WNC9_9BACL|nr:MFS transporter [Paenactinomyces guangxiensis]MBA4492943.1 MFS transporter [Paenactinomyces guangxiensis]MBH8590208.1 MFS transporter [Paenactinomyces guangxiensis]